jgi:integrase
MATSVTRIYGTQSATRSCHRPDLRTSGRIDWWLLAFLWLPRTASELVALRWDDIDLATGRLHVRRAKGGVSSVHPISARESRVLRKLLREAPASPYVFISERRAPLSAAGYQRMVARAGVAAKLTFLVHSHMLRHACGFKLANDGHDTRAIQAYLGHRSIMSTVRYTALTPNRFKHFWKD